LRYSITAKLERTLKAVAVVAFVGGAAMMAARPLVRFGDTDAPLDPVATVYQELESDGGPGMAESSDSELEDRAGRPIERIVQVGGGDTLMDLLGRAGVDPIEATQAIEALTDVYNPRNLKAGQRITVTFDRAPQGIGQGDFHQVSLAADPVREVGARRGADRGFEAVETKRQVTRQLAHYAGTIKSSLFESAAAVGMPGPVIISMIHALSYDVDFQRDIQTGDGFEVMVEGYYDSKGKLVRSGELLFASVNLSGTPIALYRYEDGQGTVDYFNAKGESIKKALLRTPVDGAKITSGFGMRHHPILGYSKMHKGVDFGVPTGTPIMAAGDGTVEHAGPNGSYGNYVRIRHSSGYATAYAHMSRVGQGVHTGKHVAQGQVIGFVGSSGRATGPHLHYEVMMGGNQVNPTSIKVPTGVKLAGRDLDRFQASKRQAEGLMARIPSATHIAADALGKPGALTN
jgi:murein DD-endopeptidase MepM/ murein hydrolase activator NlpD